ncbi:G protein-activated inward rectifier potassium channel 3-like isoform X2 [Copidosoma floridanum]|uniref:G protein-activated inward rectifier potassium channel 3-like isoform X2 n=1 Tax=Copidosoma floridanum TaxID=29053 RepID=UPI0006C95AAD|nr:G protein-activated inward rectifier potassium channel 3-like isoform X2 [Copidosoma floridanum]
MSEMEMVRVAGDAVVVQQEEAPLPTPSQHHYLGDPGMTLAGLRRAISQVSMLVVKATSSSEAAWREECQKYKQTRFSSRRVRKRVVFKHGDCNIVQGNVAKRRRRYLQDIFTTLVDAQWRWTLLVFAMTFLLSWLGFALVWWLIVYAHGDLDPRTTTEPGSNVTITPCVEDIHGFTSCFLFSVETQHTIGYGSKHTTEECPEAIFIMCIQSMTGVILQAFMVGIVFAKLSRPKKRTQTLLFSRNAVICLRDGQPCLMFRVGDMRKSHIIEAHVRAQMIKRKVTREGELLPFCQTELKVGGDGEEDKIFFIWPTTVVHKIDEQSPLYHLSASDMLRERFEIIVLLEGVIESTGMTTQARSSYLPSEIMWGHRFEHIITFRKETGEYEVNYTLFNNTYEVDTPLCSAAELDHVRALHRAKGERTSSATFAPYRIDSSSSFTSGSGSSLASSLGGLQMHAHAATPPTPIPVMITAPDDSPSRRGSATGSFTMTTDPRKKFATFYTLDETIESNEPAEVAIPIEVAEELSNVTEEEEEEEEETEVSRALIDRSEYDRAVEDVNASLRHSRPQSVKNSSSSSSATAGGSKKMSREGSRTTLCSLRNDSRGNLEGMMKKSPSHAALQELRQAKAPATRRPNATASHPPHHNHHHHHHHHHHHQQEHHELGKKTSFQLVPPETPQESHAANPNNCNAARPQQHQPINKQPV